jgi:hypothetical protein
MPYDLEPVNTTQPPFRFGAFSFPILLEACGYLFACIHSGPRWYCNFPEDPRLEGTNPDGTDTPYPSLLGGGFVATAEEANVMARMAHNFVASQGSRRLYCEDCSVCRVGTPLWRFPCSISSYRGH